MTTNQEKKGSFLGQAVNNITRKLGLVIFKAREGYHYVPNIYGRASMKLRDIREYEPFRSAADLAMQHGKTNHYYDRLYHLSQAAENIGRRWKNEKVVNVIEAGAWKGGTSYFLAYLLNHYLPGKVKMYSIDTFEGHKIKDLPGGREGKRHVPGLFSDTSLQEVKTYLASFPFVEVVPGRIQEVADRFSGVRFHLVHLDMDIAEPTRFGLNFFGERMARGGIIVVDDYGFFQTSPGIEKVVEEYCHAKKEKGITRINLNTGQCMLIFHGES